MLEVSGLTVRYGGVQAVDGVSLTVEEGEIVALVGANGAGKTSLLLAVAGGVGWDGEIRLHRESLRGRAPEDIVRAGVALVPEGRRIFSSLTVEENLRLGAAWRRDRRGADDDIARVLERFPILEERFAAPAGAMSGGQQQQLAIARALMSRPRLLLLDEPSLGLAPKLVDEVFELVAALRDDGQTILLVEQSVRQTLAICDRAYVLRTGRVELEGPAAEIAASPLIEDAYLGAED